MCKTGIGAAAAGVLMAELEAMQLGSVEPAAENAGRIRQAAEAVLSDSRFARSPVLSRLLRFLVEKALLGERVNSFTIAMDGLGRSSIDLNEADTYARVAVARLRRTLGHVYAANPGFERLVIETGTYAVRIEAPEKTAEPSPAPIAEPQGEPVARLTRARWPLPPGWSPVRWGVALGMASLVLAAILVGWHEGRRAGQWSTNDLPRVSVTFEPGSLPPAKAELYRQQHLGALSAYAGLIVVDGEAAAVDFRLKVYPSRQGAASEVLYLFEEVRTGRIVWSLSKPAQDEEGFKDLAQGIAGTIATPNGILHSHSRRQGYKADSPYGCWLRFTENVQGYNTIGDATLRDCARNWYEVAPQRALAAFLYSWTLTDQSVTRLRPDKREETLRQAVAVVGRARVQNPDFAVLHISEMRAYSFLGDRQRSIASAERAIATARNNRLVIGMAASGMATWNDPRGAVLLRGLQEGSDVTHPWEHVGLFMAAMMADDVAEAGRQVRKLEAFSTSQPLLIFLAAAHAGRSGDRDGAQAALARLQVNPLTSFTSPKRVIDRLPLAPEIKSRLRAWIGEALVS